MPAKKPAAKGGRRRQEPEPHELEQRYADDGELYTWSEFMEFYPADKAKLKWEQAKKPLRQKAQKKRNWEEECEAAWERIMAVLEAESERTDLTHFDEPLTIENYLLMRPELVDYATMLGRTCGKQRNEWRNVYDGMQVFDDWVKAEGEKRVAEDGGLYTYLEFADYYGLIEVQAKWEAAAPKDH